MPYVFTTSYLPLNKTKEAAKIYVDTLKDYRAEVRGLRKEIVPNAVKARYRGSV